MKLIIAGSRTLHPNIALISALIEQFPFINVTPELEIVSGGAPGVDRAGEAYALALRKAGWPTTWFPSDLAPEDFKLTIMNANWNKHGRAAGPIRNQEMAEYADALLLIWDGESKGSKNMRMEMVKRHKLVGEVILRKVE